jgi:hypothetical protein
VGRVTGLIVAIGIVDNDIDKSRIISDTVVVGFAVNTPEVRVQV